MISIDAKHYMTALQPKYKCSSGAIIKLAVSKPGILPVQSSILALHPGTFCCDKCADFMNVPYHKGSVSIYLE